jgi:hypothetical protein
MNGSIRPAVVIIPLPRPQNAPPNSATAAPMAIAAASVCDGVAFIARIISPPTKADIEPTDRSSPPAAITNVAPTPITTMKALRVTTLVRFCGSRKRRFTAAPSRISNPRARNGASVGKSGRQTPRAAGPARMARLKPPAPRRRSRA